MASMSEEEQERIETVSKFLLQSPPGEINDVLNDVRVLIGDDESLETGILPALTQYNLEQLTVAEVPGAGHSSIVSIRARIPGEEDRFLDPRSKTSFLYNHLTMVRPLSSHYFLRPRLRLFRRKFPIHRPMNPTRRPNPSGLLWKRRPCNTFLPISMTGRHQFSQTPTRRASSSRSLQINTIP
jgi:hypothetical protein